MHRFLALITMTALGTSISLAGSWTGRLVDFSCIERQGAPASACDPGPSTTHFAVQTGDGRVHPLDPTGNAKAAEMMHDQSTRGDATRVTITGDPDGGIIRVERIDIDEIRK